MRQERHVVGGACAPLQQSRCHARVGTPLAIHAAMHGVVLAYFLVVLAPAPLRLPELLAEVGEEAPAVEVAESDVEVRRAAIGVAGAWDDPVVSVMTEAIPLGTM